VEDGEKGGHHSHDKALYSKVPPPSTIRPFLPFHGGEVTHFAGIHTFLKAPYLEDVNNVGDYVVAVVGVPFDGGCTYRPGISFGPQGIHLIAAIYMPYNYERRIDLRKQMSLCDLGGVFTIPANLEKSFGQISNTVTHIASTGAFPLIMGRDYSIGFPTIHGIASVTSKEHLRYSHRWTCLYPKNRSG
jgi:agmatinase